MKILLALCGTFLISSVHAQYTTKDAPPPPPQPNQNPVLVQNPQGNPAFFFNVNIGAGVPVGGYSVNGCASTGGNVSVLAGLPFNSRIALVFKFDYGWNSINQAQFLDSIVKESNIPGFEASFPTAPGNYTYEAFSIGLNSTRTRGQWSTGFRFLIGDMFANVPSVTVTGYLPATGQSQTVTTVAASGQAFTFDGGFFIKYKAQPDLGLCFSIDYIYADPSFSSLNLSGNGTTPSQVFSAFNFDVGLEYTIFSTPPPPAKRMGN